MAGASSTETVAPGLAAEGSQAGAAGIAGSGAGAAGANGAGEAEVAGSGTTATGANGAGEVGVGSSGTRAPGVDGVGAGVSRDGWYCLATVSIGYMLVSWGMNPISSILPTISTELQIDVTAAGWVMNAYFLLLVGSVLVIGRLGDILGHRYVFSAGVAI